MAIISWLSGFLYGSVPALFTSELSVSDASARLAKVVKPSVFSALSEESAVGTVTEEKVKIERVIPFVGSSYKPLFIGTFEQANVRTVLSGHFIPALSARVGITIWLGLVLLWTVLSIVAVAQKNMPYWWFPLPGIGMFIFGLALVRVCKWFSRNDIDWLSKVICEALGRQGLTSR